MPPAQTPRASSVVEWLLAAAGTVGVLWAAASYVRPYVSPALDTHAEVTATETLPSGVPSGAASTPLLILDEGLEARLGMTEADLTAALRHCKPAGAPQVSGGAFGPRTLRGFSHGRTRFFVQWESIEPGGPARVTGIFVQ
jgi:hypothetical protein